MKPQVIHPRSHDGIVGARLAAKAIGVHEATVFRYLAEEVSTPSADGPSAVDHGSKNGWAWRWRDANHVRAWWSQVKKKRSVTRKPTTTALHDPTNAVVSAKRSATESAEDDQLVALFGSSVVDNAMNLRDRLDTPSVRAIRKARNQPAQIPLTEVLSMVIALGFTHWPEE